MESVPQPAEPLVRPPDVPASVGHPLPGPTEDGAQSRADDDVRPAVAEGVAAVANAPKGENVAFVEKWQERLLPVMAGLLVALAAFFVFATFQQASDMQRWLASGGGESIDVAAALRPMDVKFSSDDALEYARWTARVRLEAHAIDRRYHQASLILMARVWIVYLGFLTGTILVLVGAAFILGKLREPASTIGAKSSTWEANLNTASPGLVLAVLGTVLMITTMTIRAEVNVSDTPQYIGLEAQLVGQAPRPLPPPAQLPQGAREEKRAHGTTSKTEALDAEALRRLGNDH